MLYDTSDVNLYDQVWLVNHCFFLHKITPEMAMFKKKLAQCIVFLTQISPSVFRHGDTEINECFQHISKLVTYFFHHFFLSFSQIINWMNGCMRSWLILILSHLSERNKSLKSSMTIFIENYYFHFKFVIISSTWDLIILCYFYIVLLLSCFILFFSLLVLCVYFLLLN